MTTGSKANTRLRIRNVSYHYSGSLDDIQHFLEAAATNYLNPSATGGGRVGQIVRSKYPSPATEEVRK